jgi:hypothetical protein
MRRSWEWQKVNHLLPNWSRCCYPSGKFITVKTWIDYTLTKPIDSSPPPLPHPPHTQLIVLSQFLSSSGRVSECPPVYLTWSGLTTNYKTAVGVRYLYYRDHNFEKNNPVLFYQPFPSIRTHPRNKGRLTWDFPTLLFFLQKLEGTQTPISILNFLRCSLAMKIIMPITLMCHEV